MHDTYIVSVSLNARGRLYRITDAEGRKYATENMWLASLAERYRETKTLVRMHSNAGWWYRELHAIAPIQTEQEQSA